MTLSEFIESCNGLFCPGQKGLVAVSGGVDSTVLCDLMHQAGFPFAIAHCNFHLRPGDCDRDEQFVRQLAVHYGVEVHVAQFQAESYAKEHGFSIEEAARKLRYDFFEEIYAQKQGEHDGFAYIATAHHRDDATETFFINLLRGTGIAGLHGIRPRNGHVVRPLLPFGRDEIEDFARQHGLRYVEDCTNDSLVYRRNQIRHRLMPLLRELSPGIDATMQRNMARLRDVECVYRRAVDKLREDVVTVNGDVASIRIEDIMALEPRRTLLFELLSPYGFNGAVVDDLLRCLGQGCTSTGRTFLSASHRVVVDRDCVLIASRGVGGGGECFVVGRADVPSDGEGLLRLGDGLAMRFGVRTDVVSCKVPCEVALFDADALRWPLEVRHWRAGDRLRPFGMRGRRLVSDLLTERKLSRLQKERVWVVCDAEGEVLWVAGLRASGLCAVKEGTSRVLRLRLEGVI